MIDDERQDDEQAPVPLWRMTPDEQIRRQTGLDTESLPGFVVVDPEPGAWYFDDERGEWRQEVDERGRA